MGRHPGRAPRGGCADRADQHAGHSGFFLNRQEEAHAIVAEVGAPNLKVQMDLYHCQIVQGDLATKIREYLPSGRVGHIQIAGVPGRHEPDVGEVNYPYLFELIDELGYAGHVGCEYRPRAGTSVGLGWYAPHREAQRPAH
jgi:hydroxypyruvate isomerase